MKTIRKERDGRQERGKVNVLRGNSARKRNNRRKLEEEHNIETKITKEEDKKREMGGRKEVMV